MLNGYFNSNTNDVRLIIHLDVEEYTGSFVLTKKPRIETNEQDRHCETNMSTSKALEVYFTKKESLGLP